MALYWIIFIGIALASWIVQLSLQRKFKKYSQVPLPEGMTGAAIARKMLADNGITDVTVSHTGGHLTDHYNPQTKVVNLSDSVYNSCSIAAAAYAPLKMRSALVPIVSYSSQWMSWILLAGMLLINSFPQLMLFGICLFALTTLFSIITLPVEINASRRAVEWLEMSGITDYETTPMATSALRSAAYTYVVAALSSLATLFYYIIIFASRRD